MAVKKLSQITASTVNLYATDTVVGVQAGTADLLYTPAQVARNVVSNLGAIVAGTAGFNVSTARFFVATASGNFTIGTPTGWPATGTYAEIEIQLVNGGLQTITWPSANWLKGDGTSSTAFSSMGVTLTTAGSNFIILWSTDGGTTLYGRAA